MTEKRVTVILYGCDRNLWRGGPLRIRRVRPVCFRRSAASVPGADRRVHAGAPLGAALRCRPGVRPHVCRPSSSPRLAARSAARLHPGSRTGRRRRLDSPADARARFPGITDLPQGIERLQQSASPFAAPGTGVDAATFQALDVAAKMAFLNIEAKLRETSIDGAPLMSFVRAVRHVAVDRMFLLFDSALKARMPRSADFAGAPGHGAPPDLPDLPGHPDSWKHTRFAEGNVQLSFSRDAVAFPAGGPSSLVHSADVDIDLGTRPCPREGMARQQRVPARPQDQSITGVCVALRAGDSSLLHAGPGHGRRVARPRRSN